MSAETDRRLLIAAGIAGAAALAGRVAAGPLNPPTGPITSTAGPEPRIPISSATTPGNATSYFRITQPGSYFLTGNIRQLANKAAIAIDAEDVTLDLNGFGIIGNGQQGFPLTLELNNGVKLRNGLIHAWGAYITLNQARNCIFEDLVIKGPYDGNLEAQAQNSIFRRLVIESSGEIGIAASQNSLIEDCIIVGMESRGLTMGIGASLNTIVRNCTVRDVGVGISAFGNCIVENCTVFNATSTSSFDDAAINADNGSTVRNCNVSGGAKCGVRVAGWSSAEGNRIVNSAIGVSATNFSPGPMRCRVLDNHITNCPIGVKATGTASIFARNTVALATTTAYDIPAGNTVGDILDVTAGASITATTGPWANFRM